MGIEEVFIDPCPGCEDVMPGIVTPGGPPCPPLTRRWGGIQKKKTKSVNPAASFASIATYIPKCIQVKLQNAFRYYRLACLSVRLFACSHVSPCVRLGLLPFFRIWGSSYSEFSLNRRVSNIPNPFFALVPAFPTDISLKFLTLY